MSLKRQRILYLQECIREMQEEIRQIEEDIEDNGDDPINEEINVDEEIVSLSDNDNPIMDFNLSVRAETVEQYYYVGDSGISDHYCHIQYLGDHRCSRMFFGVLLGVTENNALSSKHIDGWIIRALLYLERQRKMGRPTEWAIMPTNFNRNFHFPFGEDILQYGNGSTSPYPALWEVKMVLIPICFRENYWCLFHLDLRTHEYQIYDTNISYISDTERNWICGHYEGLFTSYLSFTKYWPRGERLFENPTWKYACTNQCNTTPGESGVFLCMFIQNLISGRPVMLEEGTNYQETLMTYRVNMARKLYAKRI